MAGKVYIEDIDQFESHDELLEEIVAQIEEAGWAPQQEVKEEWCSLLMIELGWERG